jgi:hypothetical protein
MSSKRTQSKGSHSSGKHIPTPPPLPTIRSFKPMRSATVKQKTQSVHTGATIAYDGIGRVVWLKDIESGKIYFNQNKPLTLSVDDIKTIEQKNAMRMGMKYGGKRQRKQTRKHKRTSKHKRH